MNSLDQISLLLNSVTIDRIKGNEHVPISYSGFKLETLLRIHILPYFYPIKSYRHLAFIVAERPELQNIVGLESTETPSRATLWHFRNKNSTLFKRLLVRTLALISIDALQKGIQVHFCQPCNNVVEQGGIFDTFIDSSSGANISTSMRPNFRAQISIPTLFPFENLTMHAPQKKTSLYDEIELPIHVLWSRGDEALALCMNQPSWSNFTEMEKDLGEILGRAGKNPYTACNVIIFDKQNNHILLSKRLIGAGKGDYALPGGKMHNDESIWSCVSRELKEEVGIEFIDGHIVSDRQTNIAGFPQVRSIGVIATSWSGDIKKQNPEPYAHAKWEWYSIANLPTPLFFPTRSVLDDFLRGNIRCPLEDDLPLSKFWR